MRGQFQPLTLILFPPLLGSLRSSTVMHTSPTASSTPEAERSMVREINVACATYFPARQPMHMLMSSVKALIYSKRIQKVKHFLSVSWASCWLHVTTHLELYNRNVLVFVIIPWKLCYRNVTEIIIHFSRIIIPQTYIQENVGMNQEKGNCVKLEAQELKIQNAECDRYCFYYIINHKSQSCVDMQMQIHWFSRSWCWSWVCWWGENFKSSFFAV